MDNSTRTEIRDIMDKLYASFSGADEYDMLLDCLHQDGIDIETAVFSQFVQPLKDHAYPHIMTVYRLNALYTGEHLDNILYDIFERHVVDDMKKISSSVQHIVELMDIKYDNPPDLQIVVDALKDNRTPDDALEDLLVYWNMDNSEREEVMKELMDYYNPNQN